MQPSPEPRVATRLVQPAHDVPGGFAALTPAVHRASTVLFPTLAAFLARHSHLQDSYTYGQTGTPTVFELAHKITDLEQGVGTVLVPSGLAATTLVNAFVLAQGDHVVVPSSIYAPTRMTIQALFAKWGVHWSTYQATSLDDLAGRIQANTKLVWLESPGSNTLEVQDVPGIVAVAQRHQLLTAMDNTWATPLGFQPLRAGVDFSIQALTKYVGGHSDLLMGSVTVRDTAYERGLRATAEQLGYYVSGDECYLALRGLSTLPLRLARHAASALQIAAWLDQHHAVARVYYPPLPDDPGYALWKRDFSLGSGLLAFRFHHAQDAQLAAFVEHLRYFRLGASWGGVESLIYVVPPPDASESHLIRLHIGVEDPVDLVTDLAAAFAVIEPH